MLKSLIKNIFDRKDDFAKIIYYKNIEGWLTEKEALVLYQIAKKIKKGSTVVEIGSWQGKSSYCIAKGLDSDIKFFAIDPFDGTGTVNNSFFEKKMKEYESGSVLDIFMFHMSREKLKPEIIPKKGYSQEFKNEFDKIDFLFIDGNHSLEGVLEDYRNYEYKIPAGGYIALHDYKEGREGLGPTHLVKNVPEFYEKYEFIGLYDTVWVGKKKKL